MFISPICVIIIGIDHHGTDATFATCGDTVDFWDEHRSVPIQTYSWGVDTIHSVKFNPIEVHIERWTYTV